jgi:hypothetical protein
MAWRSGMSHIWGDGVLLGFFAQDQRVDNLVV